jgi:hypothetical protein
MRKTIIENAKRNVLQTIVVVGMVIALTWVLFGCGGSGQSSGQQGTTVINQPQQQDKP